MDDIKTNKIAIAVDVVIFNKEGKVLLGKRLAEVGYGTWAFPGGHLNDDESLLDTAKRELEEELGDKIKINISKEIIAVRDDSLPPRFIRHLVIILKGEHIEGDPVVNEPEFCEKWEWFDIDKLPSPLFSKADEVLKNYVNNKSLIVESS